MRRTFIKIYVDGPLTYGLGSEFGNICTQYKYSHPRSPK